MKKWIITVLLLCIACSRSDTHQSILAGSNCGPLCWNGIVIGKTDKQDLLNRLAGIKGINQDSVEVIDKSPGVFEESVIFSLYEDQSWDSADVRAEVGLLDGKVVAIIFRGNLRIKFQDVLDSFSEPEIVFAIKNHDGAIDIEFINSSSGLRFGFVAPNTNMDIAPDTDVQLFEFFAPFLYDQMQNAGLLTSARYSPDEFILYPWSGYGDIRENYWPPRKP